MKAIEGSEEEEGFGDFLWIFFSFIVTFFCDMYSEQQQVLL